MSASVPCSGPCARIVKASRARRRITVWARAASKRGTLTEVALMEIHEEFLCDDCVRLAERERDAERVMQGPLGKLRYPDPAT